MPSYVTLPETHPLQAITRELGLKRAAHVIVQKVIVSVGEYILIREAVGLAPDAEGFIGAVEGVPLFIQTQEGLVSTQEWDKEQRRIIRAAGVVRKQ